MGRLFGKVPANAKTLEEKLDVLARCGLKLQPPFTAEDLLRSWKREEFEKNGYELTLVGLGMTEEQPPWRNYSRNVWHFDTECIEGDGSYRRIAERLSEIAQGALPLANIKDHVDLEEQSAWLAFFYRGEEIRLTCKVDDDWIDASIFRHFVELLAKADPSKIYLYYDLHGQDCLFACVTKAEFRQLQEAGIAFRPLD